MPKTKPLSELHYKDKLFRDCVDFRLRRKEMDRKELAKRIGIGYSTLCDHLAHPDRMRRGTMMRVMRILEFSEEEKVNTL